MITNSDVHEIAKSQLDSVPKLPDSRQQAIVEDLVEQLKYSFIIEILSDFAVLQLRYAELEAKTERAK